MLEGQQIRKMYWGNILDVYFKYTSNMTQMFVGDRYIWQFKRWESLRPSREWDEGEAGQNLRPWLYWGLWRTEELKVKREMKSHIGLFTKWSDFIPSAKCSLAEVKRWKETSYGKFEWGASKTPSHPANYLHSLSRSFQLSASRKWMAGYHLHHGKKRQGDA